MKTTRFDRRRLVLAGGAAALSVLAVLAQFEDGTALLQSMAPHVHADHHSGPAAQQRAHVRNLRVRKLREVVDDVKDRMIGRHVDDRAIGKDAIQPLLESDPIVRSEEAVREQEAPA